MKPKKRKHKRLKRPGVAPGTLEYTGEKQMESPLVLCVQYNQAQCSTKKLARGESPVLNSNCVNWFDIRGLHDVSLIESYGQQFNIHPLVLEDILNTQQRPKFEEYGNDVFVVLSALTFNKETHEIGNEQIAIYFGENFLLTFQEIEDDTFLPVRERIEKGSGRIRSRKPDYLAYALLDSVVDNYFHILDRIEEHIDELETGIQSEPSRAMKENIHHFKYQMLTLRKSVLPLREAVSRFSRCESKVVDPNTGIFVRDLYDHLIRITDLIETYRDMLNGLQELYLSELSYRMNNVMKVLTIITTIFVPLTFLAGLYGMNFDNIPELHWHYGYYYLLFFMFLIFIGSLVFFRVKKWI
jgi:magnesium transporter